MGTSYSGLYEEGEVVASYGTQARRRGRRKSAWYTLLDAFPISRGVKQGSVLSPTLFLVVMDKQMCLLRESNHGLCVRGTYMGAAIHADDLRTSASSTECVAQQDEVINQFSAETKLNSEKFEIVKISLTL